MAKPYLFFILFLLIQFTSGCLNSPKAELLADETDVSINTLSNSDRTLNITIRVHNSGELDAQNVTITAEAQPILEGGRSTLIGSTMISKISSGSEAEASITWDTKKTYKKNIIKITIDPMDSIEEDNKLDNVVLLSYSIN